MRAHTYSISIITKIPYQPKGRNDLMTISWWMDKRIVVSISNKKYGDLIPVTIGANFGNIMVDERS